MDIWNLLLVAFEHIDCFGIFNLVYVPIKFHPSFIFINRFLTGVAINLRPDRTSDSMNPTSLWCQVLLTDAGHCREHGRASPAGDHRERMLGFK